MKKKAFITGITGQDGSYLAELLLEKDYEVHGLIRRSSLIKTDRIDHIFDKLKLHYGDITDGMNLMSVMLKVKPDEVYNLAAQSHVAVSFEMPEYTANADALGTLRLLEIIHTHMPTTKFYQASTSELFGNAVTPQSEITQFQPRSPYGAAKLYAYWLVKTYREAYNLQAVNGILFNHESPRRGETFVTRKITRWIAKYKLGLTEEPLILGNVYACRDWSHAKDMVNGMWLMLQQSGTWKDYVLGSNTSHSILEFLEMAFDCANIEGFEWHSDQGIGTIESLPVILTDSKYQRKLEVNNLEADSSLVRKELGWKPKYTLKELIQEMIEHDIKVLSTST